MHLNSLAVGLAGVGYLEGQQRNVVSGFSAASPTGLFHYGGGLTVHIAFGGHLQYGLHAFGAQQYIAEDARLGHTISIEKDPARFAPRNRVLTCSPPELHGFLR